jgi:hypothetical protein
MSHIFQGHIGNVFSRAGNFVPGIFAAFKFANR